MRSQYLAVLAGAFILGLPAFPAFAQNVLVPQDYNPPSQPTDASGNPIEAPQPSFQPSLPSLDSNQADVGLTSSVPMSQIPTNNAGATNQFDRSLPTQVVKMSATEASSIPGNEVLSEVVKISFKDYLWGPQDIDAVNQTLHIASDQVPKICHLSLTGMVNSDSTQSSYFFDMGSTLSDVMVFYDGKSSGVNILTRAMCDKVPLPPNSGIVMQVGDKYSVLVTTTTCPPPPANDKTLTFKYAGNGKGSCLYQ